MNSFCNQILTLKMSATLLHHQIFKTEKSAYAFCITTANRTEQNWNNHSSFHYVPVSDGMLFGNSAVLPYVGTSGYKCRGRQGDCQWLKSILPESSRLGNASILLLHIHLSSGIHHFCTYSRKWLHFTQWRVSTILQYIQYPFNSTWQSFLRNNH